MKDKPLPLVRITWTDSASLGGHWADKTDVEDLKTEIIDSVGFVFKETDDSVTIVAHVGEDQVGGTMCIPKIAIVSRRTISERGK